MTAYLFRLWCGPCGVADLADECASAGLHVAICGTEHVYVLQDSALDSDDAADAIQNALSPRPGTIPNLWAKLSEEEAAALRGAYTMRQT